MAKTRAQQQIAEVKRRAARGEITAEQAQTLTAELREEQANQLWRAALDTAASGGQAQPVKVRLIGQRADVAGLLSVLDQVTTLTDVSTPRPADALVRVYATALRRFPLTGGSR